MSGAKTTVMALEKWDWFVDLAEKGNFRKAATSQRISQQTLSARLAALEKDVGAKLVERSVPLSLTPAGTAFLLYAREQQQSQRDLMRQIGEATGSGSGVLKVGVSPLRARIIMPRVIRVLSERFPRLRVQLVEGTNRELVRMAEHGEADAVIARFESTHPGVDVVPLYQEQVALAVRVDLLERVMGMPAAAACNVLGEQGISALQECPFVLGTVDDIAGRVAYSELRCAGVTPRVAATSESIDTLLALAKEGIGAMFAPRNVIEHAAAPGNGDSFTSDCDRNRNRDRESLVSIPLSNQATYTIELGIPMQQEPWEVRDALKATLLEEAKRIKN